MSESCLSYRKSEQKGGKHVGNRTSFERFFSQRGWTEKRRGCFSDTVSRPHFACAWPLLSSAVPVHPGSKCERRMGNDLQGYHEKTFPNGDVYRGGTKQYGQPALGGSSSTLHSLPLLHLECRLEFVDGKRHGKGTYISHDGHRYEGLISVSRFNAFPSSRGSHPTSLLPPGEWKDDMRHGRGTFIFAKQGEAKDATWGSVFFLNLICCIQLCVKIDNFVSFFAEARTKASGQTM